MAFGIGNFVCQCSTANELVHGANTSGIRDIVSRQVAQKVAVCNRPNNIDEGSETAISSKPFRIANVVGFFLHREKAKPSFSTDKLYADSSVGPAGLDCRGYSLVIPCHTSWRSSALQQLIQTLASPGAFFTTDPREFRPKYASDCAMF
jgi:hypothetical protein